MALTFPQVVAHQMPRQNAQHHDSPPTVLADASACLRLGSEGLSLSLSPSPISCSYAAMLHAKHMSTSNCPE